MITASIDIGTNTVLMLIADISGGDIKRIHEEYAVARLGQGVDKTGIINEEAIRRAAKILNEFKLIADNYNCEKILPVATSASRDAKNGPEVIAYLSSLLDSRIRVISGDEEARLSYIGTVEASDGLVIDIGGGSTELIYGINCKITSFKSLNIGAVRLTERYFSKQPPRPEEIISAKEYIENNLNTLQGFPEKIDNVFTVAGTATTIATTANGLKDYEVHKIDGYRLNRDKLNEIFESYSTSGSEFIIDKLGVNPGRADLISAGTLILKTIVENYGFNELTVSAKGLRYGIIRDYIDKTGIDLNF
jgi:exopolyphosphatase/guanosine-5'-triphosphate,3'-diphosphate pyrophosphatase